MSAELVELLGGSLMGAGEEISTADALAGKPAVALYFSAHWCPPCRGFTPQLAEWYTKDLKAKGLEVVFISGDKDEAAFKEYVGEQPWLSIPYADREAEKRLKKKFKVQGIPSLVILDAEGKTITKEGRSAISGDPTGEEFPWKPVPPAELLQKAKLVNAHGEVTLQQSLEGKKGLALYFSAHWCPPCRGFTPKLAEWYKEDLQANGLEVIFVSSDKDESSFKDYFAEQPWLALDYGDRKLKEQLSEAFGVSGIPSLVILDTDLNVVTKEGRAAITADPKGLEMPWFPKPVGDLKQGPGDINGAPTLLLFCETTDFAEQRALEAALIPIAERYRDKAKAAGEDPEVNFVMVTEGSGLAPRIRGMVGLPGLQLQKHEHPLELKEASSAGGWNCDGCQGSGQGKERYRCAAGCDFDFCGECNEKANAGGEVEKMAPRLVLLDIPSDGAYYLADEDLTVTSAAVEEFLTNYHAGKLDRKQLG